MRHSLNEIEVTLRKAAVGAGYSYGLGEDIGQAGAWLCAHGHDGIAACLAALEASPIAQPPAVPHDDLPSFPDARIARCGPSAVDLLLGNSDLEEISLGDVDAPLLLAGMAGVAAGAEGVRFDLRIANGCRISISPDGLAMSGELPPAGADAVLARAEVSPAPETSGSESVCLQSREVDDGFDADEALWAEILALASRTYVPASEASRATGAGAGDIDND